MPIIRAIGLCAVMAILAPSACGQSPTVTIPIDASANRHPISPLIYGVSYGSPALLKELRIPATRMGGNNTTRYNWQLNCDNRAGDWFFESIPDDKATPGERGDTFIGGALQSGAQPMLTIPTIGWIAKVGPNREKLCSFSVEKYGPQTKTDQYMPDAGNGISKATNKPITGNDPSDANVKNSLQFQMGWVGHIIQRWGKAENGGLRYYLMDNEPSIWQETHRDVQPTGPTLDDIKRYTVAYSKAIKSADSGALVCGPEEWGWSGYLYSGFDQQWGKIHGWGDPANLPDRKTHGGVDAMPWLLKQFSEESKSAGTRLLDVFTLHFYPQGGEFGDDTSQAMQLRRNRSTRALWDPSYKDETWINQAVQLIPRMKKWVAENYPGTKVGVTEYNWGAEKHINGATAQADILGIFGRESLDVACRWVAPEPNTPVANVFKLYRNYDGAGGEFGDTSVSAVAPDPDKVAAFAAIRTSDKALTVMVVNKELTESAAVSLPIRGFRAKGPAQAYQLTSANRIERLPDIAMGGGVLRAVLPPQSITLFVVK